ncbi:MAG: hypothetical protein IT372_15020 [Polyangiaceae bacterium]|nr:hypothetical protein [Polyangiaceae bacterium]
MVLSGAMRALAVSAAVAAAAIAGAPAAAAAEGAGGDSAGADGKGAAAARPRKPCSARDRKAAEALADKGFEHFEAADYKAAAGSFEEAEGRCHSPRLLVFLARSHARLGELLRARELLEEAAGEPITKRSPTSFREAQVEARKELEALRPRIPVLQALITGAPQEKVALRLDGGAVEIAEISRGRELDPGEHTLVAEAPGFEPLTRHVVLRESTVERLELALRPVAAAPPPPERPSLAPPIAAFALGAVGIGVGAVTGILSANEVSDIKSRCEGNQCLKADAEQGDRAALLGTVSTVGFVAGGVGVAAGVLLLALRPAPAPGASASRAVLSAGPGSFRLGGTF